MNIKDALNNRYTVKSFDPSKKVSEEDFSKIKDILRWSPSSTNLQPWHFIVAENQAGLKRIAKGASGFYEFNAPKVLNASHAVVFCAKTSSDQAYLKKVLNKEDADGRFPEEDFKLQMDGGRRMFLNIHRFDWKDEIQWNIHQVYLNLGAVLLGAATLGIDACPMEGFDFPILNKEFGLVEKGLTAVAVVAFGYRKKDDFNTPENLPKSRLSEEDIITIA